MPESLIQQEFYTSWSASSDETLIPLDKIKICVATQLQLSDFAHAPRVMGIDPAYAENGDRAVIARRQGRMYYEPEIHQGIDPMALATRVANIAREWRAHYIFVDAGRGEAVWSRLHQLGFDDKVIAVNFDGKTYNDLYHRKKDEIWGRMKNHICHPDWPPQLPNHADMIKDLSAPQFEINERGKLVVESKKSIRSRGFRSTDIGDAYALTHSEELDEAPEITPEMQRAGFTEEVMRGMFKKNNGTESYDALNHMEEYIKSGGSFL
jgi:hypothetical protein